MRSERSQLYDEMRDRLEEALAGHRFTEMRDRKITFLRSESPRAWAARAIAARREGTLGPAVAEGVRQRAGRELPRLGAPDPRRTPEFYALTYYVDQLTQTTSYPDRASAPEDEPLIEDLLAAAARTDRYGCVFTSDMAFVLLAVEHAPAGDQPPRLSLVPAPEEGR
ncbi:hypothetical protein [Streptomyces sp. NPDC015350]|uniref:hypothetical protein n=1 Tax=Streptomyces sp. NPDC015350 TaxID=3364955 RepID=UPI0036F82FEF